MRKIAYASKVQGLDELLHRKVFTQSCSTWQLTGGIVNTLKGFEQAGLNHTFCAWHARHPRIGFGCDP